MSVFTLAGWGGARPCDQEGLGAVEGQEARDARVKGLEGSRPQGALARCSAPSNALLPG